MKFCDKLIKKRKENNLSQEQFADKLGVSRQAVSKWESGGTYPDMEKILKMCKILNCNLEDLMDDGVIGENTTPQKNKINLESYFKSFLNFITKVYNMFSSMRFKDLIKCLLEFLFIGMIVIFCSQFVIMLIDHLLFDLFLYMGTGGNFLHSLFYNLFQIFIAIVDVVVLLHLFKIRYLDYYMTVEDQNVKEKTIEMSVDQPKIKPEEKNKKEKIVIRDPKHSTFRFFEFLTKVVILFIKLFVVFIGIMAVVAFVFCISLVVISLCHVSYGSVFVFFAIALIGCAFIGYVVLNFIYNFLFDRKIHFKILFIVFIVGLIGIGIGGGLSISTIMNYDYVEGEDLEYSIKDQYISIEDNTVIAYRNNDIHYVIDNSLKKAKMEIKEFEDFDYHLDHYQEKNEKGETIHYYYLYYFYKDEYRTYKQILEDIKNQKIRNYHSMPEITVYISQEDYNKLLLNEE